MIGLCCLKLADCLNERSREFYRMTTSIEYAHMTANEFSREEVVAMEKEVAKAIDYDFDTCTAIEKLELMFDGRVKATKTARFLAMYLSDLA